MNLKNSPYKVIPSVFKKIIEVPSSKSYANRALILGALIGNNFKVSNLTSSTDVENLIQALEKIGIKIQRKKNEVVFQNSFPDCEKISSSKPIVLKTGDGGTTNRFLIALLALGQREYHLIPSEKMPERPIDDLLTPLRDLGVKITKDLESDVWLKILGPLTFNKKNITIDCQKSTQFASAIKLIFFNKPIEIKLINVNASESYLQMTEAVIQAVKTKNEFLVPVDFSSMGYPIALGVISGEVTITNCHSIDLNQADSILVDLLKACNADIVLSKNGLRVTNQNKLHPFNVNGSLYPDLIMTLVFIAANIDGKSSISNLAVLINKESNRLIGILNLLEKYKVKFNYNEETDVLNVFGEMAKAEITCIETERDHRMVMLNYLFLRANTGGDLYNTDCIEKSFPGFLELME